MSAFHCNSTIPIFAPSGEPRSPALTPRRPPPVQGSPLPLDCVPPDTDSKKATMENFRKTKADIPAAVTSLLDTTAAAKTQFPQVSKWAAFGLCWGGKVAVLASADSTPFTASGQTHPGRLAAEDASALTIPYILLASKDEAADVVAEYAKILKQDGKVGVVETYGTMFHGWMGARADLQDEENATEFERGYTQAAKFFASYL